MDRCISEEERGTDDWWWVEEEEEEEAARLLSRQDSERSTEIAGEWLRPRTIVIYINAESPVINENRRLPTRQPTLTSSLVASSLPVTLYPCPEKLLVRYRSIFHPPENMEESFLYIINTVSI